MALDAVGIGADFYDLVLTEFSLTQKFHLRGQFNRLPVKLKDPEIIPQSLKRGSFFSAAVRLMIKGLLSGPLKPTSFNGLFATLPPAALIKVCNPKQIPR